MSSLQFRVYGTPAPQGSKRHIGKGVMIESSKKVKPWRANVVDAARQAVDLTGHLAYAGPVTLRAEFIFARPKSHYGTGRNSDVLKASAPTWVTSHHLGDIDKLVRSTCDALVTAQVIVDDAIIVELDKVKKRYTSGPHDLPGALIVVEEVTHA